MNKSSFWWNLSLIAYTLWTVVDDNDNLFYAISAIDMTFLLIAVIIAIKNYRKSRKNGSLVDFLNQKAFDGVNDILLRFTIYGYGILLCYICHDYTHAELFYFFAAGDILMIFMDRLSPLFDEMAKERNKENKD